MTKKVANTAANIAILLFSSLLLSFSPCWNVHATDEVPTRLAPKPKMDPKPTLPEITHYVYLDIEYEWEGATDSLRRLERHYDYNVYQKLHRNKAKQIGKGYDDEKKVTSQRIILGLFGTVAPKTVENFLGLCKCDKGDGKYTKKPLCFKDTTFHRIVRHNLIQGGDFSAGDGTGGESIYGGYFEDESFEVEYKKPYLLAMANMGEPDTNGSQFFITLSKLRWLEGKNVVFGTVVDDFYVVDYIENFGSFSGKPQRNVRIVDCGELSPDEIDVKVTF